jgi:hypothetical protein
MTAQLFLLSALEAAELANSSVCQFFHDPNMGRKCVDVSQSWLNVP